MNMQMVEKNNKIAKKIVFGLLGALTFFIFCFIFLLKYKAGFADIVYPKLDKIGVRLLSKQSEFLFFIGAFIISLLQLSNKNWILAKFSFAMGCLWVVFYDSLTIWLYSLGVDSFTEAQKFDWAEAMFYLETMQNILKPSLSVNGLLLLVACAIVGLIVFGLLRFIRVRYGFSKKKFSYLKFLVGCLFITAALHQVFKTAIMTFKESANLFNRVATNFQNPLPVIDFHNTGLKVVVYIGESTSVMNMSLYGYPRKTTPGLDDLLANDPHFLRFNNVFSTHTHTSQSLLEALSVGVGDNNLIQPIYAQKRISLMALLKNGKITPYLYSNQGESGTWNLAASIIFKNTFKKFSTASGIAGNADRLMARPSDHEFFARYFEPKILSLPANESAAIFLHSYSGHGLYLDHIPENFGHPIDTYFSVRQPRALVGLNGVAARNVDEYDSAIKYVDFSVTKIIDQIKSYKQPTVFMYFSDHGDAAFADRGHDSVRFIHEMARVPFVIYFNDKAAETYPTLLKKYKNLSDSSAISTLAQVPSTIIDLLGGEVQKTSIKMLKVNGEKLSEGIQPIIIRETTSGDRYVNLNTTSAPLKGNNDQGNSNDIATDIFVTNINKTSADTKICYDRANTIGKALRGALVTDCLQLSMADEKIGADIGSILAIAKAKNKAMWIDSEPIDSSAKCTKLLGYLTGLPNKNNLVNLSSDANTMHPDFIACTQEIKKMGFRTAYKVSTNKLIVCAKILDAKSQETQDGCKTLENDLEKIIASRLFTDFSFDYDGIHAMENSVAANKLGWNTRNVNVKNYSAINASRFRMVALNNDDPNGLLY
jgi:glucan phosphoethanolaminetransferase (alkaline phosphatase superfamily)